MMENKFFQSENKFVVGKTYETIRVDSYRLPYTSIDTCDEVGSIIPNTDIFLGKYVMSQNYGYGDNRGRCDYFINDKGEQISNYLDYDGKTRYREVKSYMDERVFFLQVVESTGDLINKDNKNEHINKYILNEEVTKEICSFMNPLLK